MSSRALFICAGAAILLGACATGREQTPTSPDAVMLLDGQALEAAPLEAPARLDPDRGALRFRADPPDAEIVVNGVTQGLASDFSAPRSLVLPPGPHRIEVRKVGYATLRVEVVVAPEVLETIPITLQPLRALPADANDEYEGQED